MAQIIRLTYNDDSDGSIDIDIMLCSSKDCAKEIILDEINKGFNKEWKSLDDAANELDKELYGCTFEDDTFSWSDNGKGETYIIANLNLSEVNTEFQHIGEIC